MPSEFFDRFTRSAWRLETHAYYPADQAVFEAWLRGVTPSQAEQARRRWWLDSVSAATAAGRQIGRVHVLTLPLNAYLRFELDHYPGNQAAGEDIRIARADLHPELRALGPDFWLFDDTRIQPVLLDPAAAPGGITLADARTMRETALACSVPLADFLAELRPVGAASG
jgi:hypothetical protein